MDFVTAEEKFNELQARIRRGEPMSEDQYQEELAKLMVQDDTGVFWSLEPGTGRWLYFNGTEWVPSMPPKTPAAPPPMPATPAPVMETPQTYQPPANQAPSAQAPTYQAPPTYQETTPSMAPGAPEATPNYYAPSETPPPTDYSGSYGGSSSYATDAGGHSVYTPSSNQVPLPQSDSMPAYLRMPEPETTGVPTGGIPPRPVREASPLSVPGGERAWLPFAFGALVLLLCAVVLFFGVRGLPQFNGGTAGNKPTDVPTAEQTQVLPTETVVLQATEAPQPTQVQPTTAPQVTAAPQPVKATTTDVLNVRQGPKSATKSLGKLPKGTEVTVVGRNADSSWLQIDLPANIGTGQGWVSAQFVSVNGDVNSLPVTDSPSGNLQPQPAETPAG